MSPGAIDTSTNERHDQPRFAVVVATRDRGAKIVPLIESVCANDARDFEMVIVDQSATDETARAVAPFLADRRLRHVPSKTAGLSRARNLGIALTSAPIIAITDDDCIVPRDWLSTIARPFDAHPRVGVVFCSVEPVPVDAPGGTPHVIFRRNRIIWDAAEVWTARRTSLSLGAGMAIRRSMLADTHGFDELLGAGATFGSTEDNDLSWRGLLRGWGTYECADVAVLHDGFRTIEEFRALVIRDLYGIGGSVAKYLRAGKWQIGLFLAGWILRLGLLLPARDLLAGRRPRGFRRPYLLMRGVLDGLRTPWDRAALLYLKNSSATAVVRE